MTSKGYTVLGWVVWQLATRLFKMKVAQSRAKLGAIGAIALVIAAGVLAAKYETDD